VFKPYRLYLRLMTAALLGVLLVRNGVSRRTLGTVVCSLLLTYSEDALSLVNSHGSVRLLLRRAGLLPRGKGASRGGGAGGVGAPLPPPALVRWQLEVAGMRCQACAARVRGRIADLPGVRNATVALERGRVNVWADGGAPVTGAGLADAIASLDSSYVVRLKERTCFAADGSRANCGGGGRGEIEMAELRSQGSDASDGSGGGGDGLAANRECSQEGMSCGGSRAGNSEEL
jgi:copper chaperone CopZ